MNDWTKPRDITLYDQALLHMPRYDDIPDEFKDHHNKWAYIAAQWFFKGLRGATFTPKSGIDKSTALRHLACIQSSFDPQHGHKQAAVAYLMSLWFEDVRLPA